MSKSSQNQKDSWPLIPSLHSDVFLFRKLTKENHQLLCSFPPGLMSIHFTHTFFFFFWIIGQTSCIYFSQQKLSAYWQVQWQSYPNSQHLLDNSLKKEQVWPHKELQDMLTTVLFLCPTHFPTATSQKRLAEIEGAATRGQGKVWGSRAGPTLSGGLSHSRRAGGPECLHTTLFFPLQKCCSGRSGPSSFPLHQWLQSMIRQHNPCFLDSLAPAGMSSVLTMVAA